MLNKTKKIWQKLKSIGDDNANHASLEFLPAALEVMETPPSPAGRAILWSIVAFFVIAVVWACLGKIDIVAVAQGKITPSGRVKIIQPLEAGVVKMIHVTEGQQVQAGQILLELDATVSEADKQRLKNELTTARLDKARLETLLRRIQESESRIQNKNDGVRNSEDRIQNEKNRTQNSEAVGREGEDLLNSDSCLLNSNNPGSCILDSGFASNISPAQLDLLKQRIASEYSEYRAQAASLYQKVLEQEAELKATEEHIQQLNETIPLISERVQAVKSMLESGVVSRADWLKMEEDRIRQVKERDVQKSNRHRIEASIENSRQQQQALTSQYRSKWLSELADIENRIEAAQQEIIKAEQRQFLQKLTAPVNGKIQQLAVHTVGGVVTPAQQLMLVVPEDGRLEVEAWIENKDIGFVEESQAAEIKIEAFPYTKYGVIDGQVLNISNDAIADERQGLIYMAQVSMQKATMLIDQKNINLSPGMAVTVEIKTGKRRVIDYLMSPLLKYKEESIKER